MSIYRVSARSKAVDLLLCLFLGGFGAHRFYERKFFTGILYLLTFGFFGIGVLADLLQIVFGARTDKNNLSIGKPNQKYRKAINAGSVVVATGIWSLAAFLFVQRAAAAPLVAEDYYAKVDASLELEKKYTALGPHQVKSIQFESTQKIFKSYKIWYPSDLERNRTKRYPVVVFANGTGVTYPKYPAVFSHLASWGFIAIGNDDPSSFSGKSSSLTLDFILSLGENQQSIFHRKLDTKHIGISGHSQGGVGAINAVTDFNNSRLFTSIYSASATSHSMVKSWRLKDANYDTAKVGIPCFIVAGTGTVDAEFIAPLASLNENYNGLKKNVPAVMARRKNTDHSDVLPKADGYMTAWFRYTLMDDRDAKRAFAGQSPEILQNSTNWQDVRIKNLK